MVGGEGPDAFWTPVRNNGVLRHEGKTPGRPFALINLVSPRIGRQNEVDVAFDAEGAHGEDAGKDLLPLAFAIGRIVGEGVCENRRIGEADDIGDVDALVLMRPVLQVIDEQAAEIQVFVNPIAPALCAR